MKTKTEFLVICFLTGFSVCFLFCGVCSIMYSYHKLSVSPIECFDIKIMFSEVTNPLLL